VMHLRCGGKTRHVFSSLLRPLVKEFHNSVEVCQSYERISSSMYILHLHCIRQIASGIHQNTALSKVMKNFLCSVEGHSLSPGNSLTAPYPLGTSIDLGFLNFQTKLHLWCAMTIAQHNSSCQSAGKTNPK